MGQMYARKRPSRWSASGSDAHNTHYPKTNDHHTLPQNAEYVPDSGGETVDGEYLRWTAAALESDESREFRFAVTVTQQSGLEIVNDQYGVVCDEGVTAVGKPVITKIANGAGIYLPLVLRQG